MLGAPGRESVKWIVCLEAFNLSLEAAGILGKILGEALNKIFISFPGVSFNLFIKMCG